MGATIRILNKTTVEIDTTHLVEPTVTYEMARQMRASYYFLGSLLGRCNEASVSMPGGCDFGVRPIDQHIKGFEALGANVTIDGGMINAKADLLLGSHIYFDVVSVGATINVMLAAVKAKGLTILENVAKEPHIVDLANFLNSMGADIRGAGTDVIKIHGVDILHGTTYSIIPDQIVAAPIWLPRPPPTATSLSKMSFPNTWNLSPINWSNPGRRSSNTTTASGCGGKPPLKR